MADGDPVAVARGENYGGQSRRERAADRRARILAAAVELFGARSYEAVTVSDVCALARVSKRYFYAAFADREALLLSVHRELNDWLVAGVAAAAPRRPADLDGALRPVFTALVGLLAAHPKRARIIYINAPRMEMRRRGVLRRDAQLLGRLVRPVLGRVGDRRQYERTVLALVAGLSEVVTDWVWRGMTDPPGPLADHLTALGVAMLTPLRQSPA